MPDSDKPDTTIASANRITQRPHLLRLNFIGNYDKLNGLVRYGTVDQFRQANIRSLPDIDHGGSPCRPTTKLKRKSRLTNARRPFDMEVIDAASQKIEICSSSVELQLRHC